MIKPNVAFERPAALASRALGSGLVSPLDLTAAYAVFPTLGYRVTERGCSDAATHVVVTRA